MEMEEASYQSAARISQIKWDSRASTFVRSASSFWRKVMLTKCWKLGSWSAVDGVLKYSIMGVKFWEA